MDKSSKQQSEYLVGSIILDGIEPTERFKEYVKKERLGILSEDDKRNLIGIYKAKMNVEGEDVGKS